MALSIQGNTNWAMCKYLNAQICGAGTWPPGYSVASPTSCDRATTTDGSPNTVIASLNSERPAAPKHPLELLSRPDGANRPQGAIDDVSALKSDANRAAIEACPQLGRDSDEHRHDGGRAAATQQKQP